MFRRKYKLGFIVVVIMFICPACFEVVEEINLNKNGSGSFCFTINMSQSKLKLNAILLLDSVNGRAMIRMEDVKKSIAQAEKALRNDSSLSNISITQNWDDYIFSVRGDFKSIAGLNKAINQLNAMFNKQKKHPAEAKDHFNYANKVFTRYYNYNFADDYNSLSEKDKMVFKTARYTSIYRFKTTVGNYSNTDAMKSKNGMAIMLKANMKDLLTNRKSLENIIHLNQ